MFSLGNFTGIRHLMLQYIYIILLFDLVNLIYKLRRKFMPCLCANRENLFEDMLREPDDVAARRKRIRDTLRILQQANRVCEFCYEY